MAETCETTCNTPVIGDVAGRVWRCLEQNGPMPTARLVRQVGARTEMVQRAVGWLAREDKIDFVTDGGKEALRLK